VIFDVEVAFFFPWAEVFGKANAIANAPKPQEGSPTEYRDLRDLAEKVVDLSIPIRIEDRKDNDPARDRIRNPRGIGDYSRWLGLSRMTPEEFESIKKFRGPSLQLLQTLTDTQFEGLQKMDEKQRATMAEQAAALNRTIDTVGSEQKKGYEKLLVMARKEPKLKPALDAVAAQMTDIPRMLKRLTLDELRRLRPDQVRMVVTTGLNPAAAPFQVLRQALGEDIDAYEQDVPRYQAMITEQANRTLAALRASGTAEQERLWLALSPTSMDTIGNFTSEQAEALQNVTSGAISGIYRSMMDKAQEEARTLAWLAFWEIFVFFGVLLVGFAYLWKRGDLAWVRSTAAERLDHLAAGAAAAERNSGPTVPAAPARH